MWREFIHCWSLEVRQSTSWDAHDHPVIDLVWKLYEHAIRRIGPTATLLEWDDQNSVI